MGVLSINQNVTLPIDAVNLEKDRHQLMDMVACNQESKECMIKSVCVLSINQNVTLLLDAVNLEKDRHQLMDMVVTKSQKSA